MSPPGYMGWVITTIVLGFLFNYMGLACGGIALRQSRRVRQRWSMGDIAGARAASRRAHGFAIAGTVLNVAGFFLVVVLLLAKY